ncbi:MAG: DNA-binding protein [Flavobacteriaceae bacterium]|nr:MAG: DNA-binding protein [Flavobacteriaceae bacterium]
MTQDSSYNENPEEIFSKIFRAGRRTYFFDVRETRAGDYYLTITESKKNTQQDGSVEYKKHKIYLYKEDFEKFNEILQQTTDFILQSKGGEVISETHQREFTPENPSSEKQEDSQKLEDFTNVNFEDI